MAVGDGRRHSPSPSRASALIHLKVASRSAPAGTPRLRTDTEQHLAVRPPLSLLQTTLMCQERRALQEEQGKCRQANIRHRVAHIASLPEVRQRVAAPVQRPDDTIQGFHLSVKPDFHPRRKPQKRFEAIFRQPAALNHKCDSVSAGFRSAAPGTPKAIRMLRLWKIELYPPAVLNRVQFGNCSAAFGIRGMVRQTRSLAPGGQDHGFHTGRGLIRICSEFRPTYNRRITVD